MNDRQIPSRLSPEWNDVHWRWIWLSGLTDEELDSMTPRQKGRELVNYAFRGHGVEYYGEIAQHYIAGKELMENADLRSDSLDDADAIKLGRYITEQNAKRLERI